MSTGLTRHDDTDGLGGDSGAVGTSGHRLHRAKGPERPTCSCGAAAVRNGLTKPKADGSREQAWACPRRRQTAEARAAHAAAQARYADTEEGSYRVMRKALRERIRHTERRIAELERVTRESPA